MLRQEISQAANTTEEMRMHTMKKHLTCRVMVVVALFGPMMWSFSTCPAVDMPDNMVVVVNRDHVTRGGLSGGALGACGYSVHDGRFYTAVFGSGSNIRCFDPNVFSGSGFGVISDEDGTSWGYAYTSDIERVTRSPDIPSGYTNANWTGAFNISSMILNPAPVTYNGIQYGPGQLAIMTSTGGTRANVFDGSKMRYEVAKRLMTYDMREVWGSTNRQPDYDTAQDGLGHLMVDVYGASYGLGRVNWNDCFTSLVTVQNMADAIGAVAGVGSDNVGRQACWSPDATKVYFVGARDDYGGVWKVEMATASGQAAAVSCLYPDVRGPQYNYCEPHAINTSLRDFTDGERVGDQILFMGTSTSGNLAGLNCIVDDGTINPNDPNSTEVYNIINGAWFCDFTEIDPNWDNLSSLPKVYSITSDPNGNVFFFATKVYSTYMLDNLNRLICVKNKPQNIAYDMVATNSVSGTGGMNQKLQYHRTLYPIDDPNGEKIGQLIFQSQTKTVGGIYLHRPLDFDRDKDVDFDDMLFFRTQISRTRGLEDPNLLPSINEGKAFLDYIKADLNGNSVYDSSTKRLQAVSVNDKDVEVLYQFVYPGDTDLDNDVDIVDANILRYHFDPYGDHVWGQGDFDFDGDVDLTDFIRLKDNLHPDGYPGGPVLWKDLYNSATYKDEPILRRQVEGEVVLIVNPDNGELSLMASGVELDGYQIKVSDGNFNLGRWNRLTNNPAFDEWEVLGSSYRYMAEGSLTSSVYLDGIVGLGKVFSGDLRSLEFTYNGGNYGTIIGSADLDNDEIVNMMDLANFGNHWMGDSCTHPDWCSRSDLDFDGDVDISDLGIFMEQWLDE